MSGGDLYKRLIEEGEKEDRGQPDPWRKLGSTLPTLVEQWRLAYERHAEIEYRKANGLPLITLAQKPSDDESGS